MKSILLSSVLSFSIVLVAVKASAAAPTEAQTTLVYCSETSPAKLSPALSSDVTSLDVSRHVYDTLIVIDPVTRKIEPALAVSWTLSKDQRTYQFKLREGVKFQSNEIFKPTRALDSSDVLFSLERMWKTDHPYHKIGTGFTIFESLGFREDIKALRAPDARTIEVELKRPLVGILDRFGHPSIGSVYSREYAEQLLKAKTPDLFDSKPIGTGPFSFQSYEVNSRLVLKANADYFAGSPKLARLIFSIVPEANVRLQKILVKECDVVSYVDPRELARLRKTPGLRISEMRGNNLGFLIVNTKKKPLDDVRVRRALLAAMNRKVYVEAIHRAMGEVSEGPLPADNFAYEAVVPASAYDPALAKKLLAEAGVTNLKLDLWALPIARAYNPNGKKLAELMQADLARVGITASIENLDWPSFLSKSAKGEHELLQLGWNGISAEPDFYLYTLLTCNAIRSGNNRSNWCHPKFDELVTKARGIMKDADRKPLYHEALKIFARELPWIPVSSGTVNHVMRTRVQGVNARADGTMSFREASLTNEQTQD